MPLALILGMLAALYRNSLFDRTINVVTLTAVSSPEFFLAYVLMVFFVSHWHIFPSLAKVDATTPFFERIYRCALPSLTLLLVIVAQMMRMTRAAIINLLSSPYIEMARLKGIAPRQIIFHHALPNAWAPIANVIALNLAYLVVGVVIVEAVFVYPGIGKLMVDSVHSQGPAGRPGLRAHLRCHLHPAQSRGRHRGDRHQSALAASAVTAGEGNNMNDPTTASAEHQPIIVRRSVLSIAWRELRRAPLSAWFGMIVIAIYIIAAVFAPLIAPYSETELVGGAYDPWSAQFLLGTDQLGRDFLSRLIYASRNTIGIAILTTALSFTLGGLLGLLSAVLGGWVDQMLGRAVDVLMAIPQLIFALVLLSIVGASLINLVLIIAVLDSTRVYRVTRAVAMNVVVLDFVEAAKLQGEKIGWIMTREVLPNILPPLTAEFGLRFCFVFLTISALSFLGLGIQPPLADWGSMVKENATLINYGNVTPLLPAGAIALLTVAVNFVVDWFLHKTSGLKG